MRTGRWDQRRHCVQAKALNLVLSNFIPADRCLAGQNIHVRGERGRQREGGNEVDLQRGSKKVTLLVPCLPPSLSLLHWSGNDRFHSCFRSWRGEVVSDYQGGSWGGDVELRPKCRSRLDRHSTQSQKWAMSRLQTRRWMNNSNVSFRKIQEGNQGHILIDQFIKKY